MKNDFNALVVTGLMLIALTAVEASQRNVQPKPAKEPNKLEAVVPEKTEVKRKSIAVKLY